MAARLTLTLSSGLPGGPPAGTSQVLESGRLTLGRGPDNDWVLADPERLLSKQHCEIAWTGDAFVLTDTSTNGVFINNAQAPVGRGQTVELAPGDSVRLGDYELLARIDDDIDREDVEEYARDAQPWTAFEERTYYGTGSAPPQSPSADDDGPGWIGGQRDDGNGGRFGGRGASSSTGAGLSPFEDQPADWLDDPIRPKAPPRPPATPADHTPAEHDVMHTPRIMHEKRPEVLSKDWDSELDDLLGNAPLQPGTGRAPPPPSSPPPSPPASGADDFDDLLGDAPIAGGQPSPPPAPTPTPTPDSRPASRPIPPPTFDDDDDDAPLISGSFPDDEENSGDRVPPPTQEADAPPPPQPTPAPAAEPPARPRPPAPTPDPPPARPADTKANPFAMDDGEAARPTRPTPVARAEPPPSAGAGPTDASGEALIAAFLRGAHLDHAPKNVSPEDLMETAGALLVAMTEGLRDLLQARATVKNEIRAEQTMIRARGNNALKFSVNATEALERLLAPPGQTYMDGHAATEEAFKDLRTHELATMAGSAAAIQAVLATFDPATLEGKLSGRQGLGGLLSGGRRAKLWELYEAHYRELADEATEDFDSRFQREFRKAYERLSKDV
ncbi:type VI secretion system-associated FHA domain protein TagH [Rhodospira trueperi]|uniref:Type VI secretion system protein n=1 Tax=Rhodospira trueperi TaxID=69960 RepID=A0A1G7G5P5_9PROT|nr:type VI secretion system-associated FHA domain protein TagH [Rhodospira trueperi]SDE83430.1 type VI secretion system protein [Rhodospira trueperi]